MTVENEQGTDSRRTNGQFSSGDTKPARLPPGTPIMRAVDGTYVAADHAAVLCRALGAAPGSMDVMAACAAIVEARYQLRAALGGDKGETPNLTELVCRAVERLGAPTTSTAPKPITIQRRFLSDGDGIEHYFTMTVTPGQHSVVDTRCRYEIDGTEVPGAVFAEALRLAGAR